MEYYLIFIFTTAVFAVWDIFLPELRRAKQDGITNVLTENPKLSVYTYFCISAIIAPLIVLFLLVPGMNERFRAGANRVIREQE